MQESADKALVEIMQELNFEDDFRSELRSVCNKSLRYHSTREITVQMPFGTHQKVKSDWYQVSGKCGLRKRGPKKKKSNRKGCHLFLEALGFQRKTAPEIIDKALQMSAICPSGEIASNLMKKDGVTVSQNKIRKFIDEFRELSDDEYANLAISEDDAAQFKNKRLLLCVDGGRINCRYKKNGRIAKNMKRHRYDTDWKEPKLFTVYALLEDGSIDESIAPLVDGVIGDKERLKARLKAYLKKINVSQCKEITIACDGASWHWTDLKKLLTGSLKVSAQKVNEVIDYMHAKGALHEILENCRFDTFNSLDKEKKEDAYELLYQGKIKELIELVKPNSLPGFKKKNRDKLSSYFERNQDRMQYKQMQESGLPIGSGHVESAIRRVVNLRIKSSSSFWYEKNAEAMIFIRSQVLYGRWGNVMHNYRKSRHKVLLSK